MPKMDISGIATIGALLVGGYFLVKYLPGALLGGITKGLGDLLPGFGGFKTYPTPERAPTETIVHFTESIRQVDPETKESFFSYDPFGISKVFAAQVLTEQEKRGVAWTPPKDIFDPLLEIQQVAAGYGLKDVETQPTEKLIEIAAIPPLDPFGISDVFQQKAAAQIIKRKQKVSSGSTLKKIQPTSTAQRLSALKQRIASGRSS